MQVVLEEGLDISCLPETLKGDFKQLDRLEGQFRMTSYHIEVFDLEDLSPRKVPPCSFCNSKERAKKGMKIMEDYKPLTTFYKVILGELLDFNL